MTPPPPAGPVPAPYPNEAEASEPAGAAEGPASGGEPPVPAGPESSTPAPAPVPLELVEPTASESTDPGQGPETSAPSTPAPVTDEWWSEPSPSPAATPPAGGGDTAAEGGAAATPPEPTSAMPSPASGGGAEEKEAGAGSNKVARAVMRPFRALSRSAAPERSKAGAAPPASPPAASRAEIPAAGPPPALVQRVAQPTVSGSGQPPLAAPTREAPPGAIPEVESGELAPPPGEGSNELPLAPSTVERLAEGVSTGSSEARARLARSSTAPTRPAATTIASRGARPALRLVAAHEPVGGTATLARSETPQTQQVGAAAGSRRSPTSGARLADATGARLTQGEGGYETVVFPRPSGLAFAPAVSLMRAADGAPEPAAQPAGDAPAAPQEAPAPAPAPGGGGGGGGEIEEIYTQVIERLRRDLLADRERMGDLLGDLP